MTLKYQQEVTKQQKLATWIVVYKRKSDKIHETKAVS